MHKTNTGRHWKARRRKKPDLGSAQGLISFCFTCSQLRSEEVCKVKMHGQKIKICSPVKTCCLSSKKQERGSLAREKLLHNKHSTTETWTNCSPTVPMSAKAEWDPWTAILMRLQEVPQHPCQGGARESQAESQVLHPHLLAVAVITSLSYQWRPHGEPGLSHLPP